MSTSQKKGTFTEANIRRLAAIARQFKKDKNGYICDDIKLVGKRGKVHKVYVDVDGTFESGLYYVDPKGNRHDVNDF